MSRDRRSPLPGPIVWAAGMVATGLAIEAVRDGDVAWIAAAPLVLVLALALARGRGSASP